METIEQARKQYGTLFDFSKEKPGDKIFWTYPVDEIGVYLFTFDKKKIYNLFEDFPHNLTKDEVRIFVKENPFWADFFHVKSEEPGIT